MQHARIALGVFFMLAACDRGSDERLASLMDEVATQHVAKVQARSSTLAAEHDARQSALTDLERRVAELEVMLGATQARIEAFAGPPGPSALVGDPDAAVTYKMTLGDAHTKGPDTALVTVVVWSDFQCPHCARVEPTLQLIEESSGEAVRVAFKHCPLESHERARPAAIAAEAAGRQGKFWEMHDELFANFTDLSDANFTKWAKAIGLDVERFDKDLSDPALSKRVDDQKAECTAFGIAGVPSFYVNGRPLEEWGSRATVDPLIADVRAQAQRRIAAGTSPAEVYDAVIATGRAGE